MIAVTVVSVLIAIGIRHYRLGEHQRKTIDEIKRLGSSHNVSIWFLYDDIAKWNERTEQWQMLAPDDTGAPSSVSQWAKAQFGIDFVYKPVVMMYDSRDVYSELCIPPEMVDLVRTLPIRELRVSKSSYIRAEMFNMLTDDEHAKVAELFPEQVVVKVPDDVYP